MNFKVRDIVYYIRVNNARLTHQIDGLGLMKCYVIKVRSELHAKITEILCFVGKNEYARSSSFYPVGHTLNIREWNQDITFHKELFEAQKEMIIKTFDKKEWL